MNDTEKMAIYTGNVNKIATFLFSKFYRVDEFDVYYNEESENCDKQKCVDKAARLYQFYNNVDEVKKMVEFLNTVNPGLAKELVDGL